MPDCLRWPRLWYATPTFVLFVALQAPDWRLTGRVAVALVVWAAAGVAIDIRMNRRPRQPALRTHARDIRRLINWSGIIGFVLGIPAGLYARVFRPAEAGGGALAAALNKGLESLGVLLPGLDIFHRELLETGRFAYAAYLGSFFVLVVVLWVPSFILFYRAFANMPSTEFAKVAEGSPGLKKPPYDAKHRLGAWLRLAVGTAVLVAGLLLFGRTLPMDAAHPESLRGSFMTLGVAGTAINIFIYILHNYRRFLSTLQPDGFLPAGDRNHA